MTEQDEAVRDALRYIDKALDKASYGDSVEGDLLEARATLDSYFASPPPAAPVLDVERLRQAIDTAIVNQDQSVPIYPEYIAAAASIEYARLTQQEDDDAT